MANILPGIRAPPINSARMFNITSTPVMALMTPMGTIKIMHKMMPKKTTPGDVLVGQNTTPDMPHAMAQTSTARNHHSGTGKVEVRCC